MGGDSPTCWYGADSALRNLEISCVNFSDEIEDIILVKINIK